MSVGERIRERLSLMGLSQAELARRVGISQPMVNALIRGSARSTTHLHKIARELGTTPAYLTGEASDPDADVPDPPLLDQQQLKLLEHFACLNDRARAAMLELLDAMRDTGGPRTVHAPTTAYRAGGGE
ncbi:helix-turn-helix domain-containing protein [Sphingomonas sp. IW22]|uniref:helix-turn-helix domain-containing protein n=1 Tax=Sphingomonas sp. IW22 TaxID=3242489 RepID=UPI003520B27A